mmetsp:Transcript_3527/g.9228  ORF Transcript_3527/g.9228 Transcript_3527/m.9228 type:complete len:342 (+) Transcript_3527:426-1451(+)
MFSVWGGDGPGERRRGAEAAQERWRLWRRTCPPRNPRRTVAFGSTAEAPRTRRAFSRRRRWASSWRRPRASSWRRYHHPRPRLLPPPRRRARARAQARVRGRARVWALARSIGRRISSFVWTPTCVPAWTESAEASWPRSALRPRQKPRAPPPLGETCCLPYFFSRKKGGPQERWRLWRRTCPPRNPRRTVAFGSTAEAPRTRRAFSRRRRWASSWRRPRASSWRRYHHPRPRLLPPPRRRARARAQARVRGRARVWALARSIGRRISSFVWTPTCVPAWTESAEASWPRSALRPRQKPRAPPPLGETCCLPYFFSRKKGGPRGFFAGCGLPHGGTSARWA